MFKVRVKVENPAAPERYFEEDFWVDTGALYSYAPEDRLEAIGLVPAHAREPFWPSGSPREARRPLTGPTADTNVDCSARPA